MSRKLKRNIAKANKAKQAKQVKVPDEKWGELTTALSGAMDSLFTTVDACNILKGEKDFDRELLFGYYRSAKEIKDEIIAINNKIEESKLQDVDMMTFSYLELVSEVSQLEALTAALSHDTVTELVTLDIVVGSDDLNKDLDKMKQLGVELMESQTQGVKDAK